MTMAPKLCDFISLWRLLRCNCGNGILNENEHSSRIPDSFWLLPLHSKWNNNGNMQCFCSPKTHILIIYC